MTFELILNITGLCAYQPAEALREKNNACTVLLPNARNFMGPKGKESHRPVWLIEEPFLRRKGGRVSRKQNEIIKDKEGRRFFVYDLDRYPGENKLELGRSWTIEPTEQKKLNFYLAADPPLYCPSDANKTDFRWVVGLEEIEAKTGTLKPIAMSRNPGHQGLACRVALTEGTLSVSQFASKDGHPDLPPIKWVFRGARGLKDESARAIAEVVTLRRPIPDGTTPKLVPTKWVNPREPPPDEAIELTPVDGKVVIWLKNQPEADFLSDPKGRTERDHHFSAFYELCTNRGDSKIPYRAGYCTEDDKICPAFAGNPQCPGTRFEP